MLNDDNIWVDDIWLGVPSPGAAARGARKNLDHAPLVPFRRAALAAHRCLVRLRGIGLADFGRGHYVSLFRSRRIWRSVMVFSMGSVGAGVRRFP